MMKDLHGDKLQQTFESAGVKILTAVQQPWLAMNSQIDWSEDVKIRTLGMQLPYSNFYSPNFPLLKISDKFKLKTNGGLLSLFQNLANLLLG